MPLPRMLAAFEAPQPDDPSDPIAISAAYEEAWDSWINDLRSHHLLIVNDLDPVAVTGTIEIYEVMPA